MKKLFIVTLAVLFFAGAAYAVEYDYSGMINTRGSYILNTAGDEDSDYDFMYYDMEFDSTLKINPSDKSSIYLNWEIHDENFEQTPGGSNDKTGDDNIVFKRAYGTYKFDNGMQTQFGLMTGAAFGTAFADNSDGRYRVRLDGTGGFGKWGVILEKNLESGNDGDDDWDGEKDDSDAYYAYLVTKAGDITLQFLGGYVINGDVTNSQAAPGGLEEEDPDAKVIVFVAAAMGAFGDFGWEAELDIQDKTYEFDGSEDTTAFGLYGNGWFTMDNMKLGLMAAYASYDDEGGATGTGDGFGMGEDFGPGYWVMDWEHFGSNGRAEYFAATLVAAYIDYSVSDALSLYGALEYMMSNEEDTEYEDATGVIGNFGLGYKLADNVKYSIGAAYGQFDGDDFDEDPDAFARAYHKIQISL